MKLELPDFIFIRNRVVQYGDLDFRLDPRFQESLAATAPQSPLPVIPPVAPHALVEAISLVQYFAPYTQLAPGQLSAEPLQLLAGRVIDLATRCPDGAIAAILLCPWQDYVAHHAINTALLACRMAIALGLPEPEQTALVLAALGMNLGAVALQNELASQNAPLSTGQRQLINAHPLISSALLRAAGLEDERLHTLVLTHHERRDGRGYPFHLREDEIDPLAHLLHVLDIVIAKLMPRSYRSRLPARQALAQVYAAPKEPLDPQYAAQLVKVFGIYPCGSFVKLEDGQTALVVSQTDAADKPMVAVPANGPTPVDTSTTGRLIQESVASQPSARHFATLVPFWPF
ncbi:HD-GYP domain-containing protein [Silvimonas soli]|uniref:HD-GYP domain-containing protein n=1 Tax=Silvimonas soli TaxID=2980100 RepID=UPI0024B399D7|nr:HD domain-containing phosphohydrolase [Silvimonas soli]